MTDKTRRCHGASTVSLLIGMALLAISITGALKLMGVSMRAQNDLNTEKLVDQVNRIGEIITVHLNRGGSYQNPDVDAKGIQLCSLQNQAPQCNGYQASNRNFCLSIPTRVSRGGNDIINLTGFRLMNGVLAQRQLNGVNMAQFAIAWVLQNPNVAGAIVGASKPEQIISNIEASGVEIPVEIMAKVDEVLGELIERDPAKTKSPEGRLC